MSKINQIQNRIRELDGGRFQKIADAYLHKIGYERINPIGSVIGADKVRKGTPDTLIPQSNGKYIFAEHTTEADASVYGKLKSDLDKCLDPAKTGVPMEKIEEVVFCHTSTLSASEEYALAEECQQRGINLNIFGIGPLSFDLFQKYPGLAREFLHVEVDTGQIVTPDEFVAAYNKNKLATRLDTTFHFRETEVEQASQGLQEHDLVIVSGRPGVGKSRLALECCERFTEAHPNYEVRCIFNRGPDLFEDLRIHFSEPGRYLIFVDDANRVSGFKYIIQLLQDQREDQQVKVIATVRDYALDRVRETAQPYGGGVAVAVRPFDDEQIGQLVEQEYEIHNQFYLERIAAVAKGNPRLAIMAAEVAKQEGTLQSIGDVSALYDEYFASIRKGLEELESRDLLKVAGIVTFFRVVDRSNEEMMRVVEQTFAISSDAFWESAHRLHNLEVFDLYEDEVEIVRVSDQILATYLFYLAFFKEQVLDFADLLDHFFPQLSHKLIDAINPVLGAFGSEALMDVMRPQVERVWQAKKEAGDEEGLLHLMEVFWFLKRTDTLLYISERISQMEPESVDLSILRAANNAAVPSPSILSILGSFAYSDEDTRRMALDLLFDYLVKCPSDFSLVLHLLTEQFGFTHRSYIQGFTVQSSVVDLLGKRVQEGRNELFSKLFVAVAENYLQTHFSNYESKGPHAIDVFSYDLPVSPELMQLRKGIWTLLFRMCRVPTLRDEVLDVLNRYSMSGHATSVDELITHDATEVLRFIESELDPDSYKDCSVVQDYIDLLDQRGIAFDGQLRESFRNETYRISDLLLDDRAERQILHLGYTEYQQYKKRRIAEYFAHYTFDDYKRLFTHCLGIREYLDQRAEYQLHHGVSEVLLALADRNPSLYVKVLEYYLDLGNPLELVSVPLVKELMMTCGLAHSYDVLRQPNYSRKHDWLFSYFQLLGQEEITNEHLTQLYALYREAESSELPYDFDFLLKYRALEQHVVARVTAILLEKVKTDPNVASVLSGLLNQHAGVNKMIVDLFADNLELLKRAYFAALDTRENVDHERQTLASILDLDSGFISDYIDYMYEHKDLASRYNDNHDYAFLWMRANYQMLMAQGAERIYKQEQNRITLSNTYLSAFFRHSGEDNHEVVERQNDFLIALIERRHNDPDFMEFVFQVVAQFPPDRRRYFIVSFVKHNSKFEDFERLPLEPNLWDSSGSAVPTYQGRVEYLESLAKVLNTVDLLQHRQYVERRIEGLRSRIEDEKRNDFSKA